MPAFSDGMPHEDILEQQITNLLFIFTYFFINNIYLSSSLQFFRLAKVEKITREKNVKKADRTKL